MVRRFANVNGETLFLLLSQQKKIRLKRSQRTWNIKIHSTGSHSKRRDFRCKNISNCCRNTLTLFDCLFFFSLLLMYTICQGHESSSTNLQSRWNFIYNLSSFFYDVTMRMKHALILASQIQFPTNRPVEK